MSRRRFLWMFVDLATLLIECPAALLFLIGIHPKNQNAFQVRIVKCWQPKGAGRGRAHACQRPTSFLRTLQAPYGFVQFDCVWACNSPTVGERAFISFVTWWQKPHEEGCVEEDLVVGQKSVCRTLCNMQQASLDRIHRGQY